MEAYNTTLNHNNITVPLHGGLYHATCIMIASYICWKRGYKLKSNETFSMMSHAPGIPDIFVEFEYKGKDDHGHTKTFRESVCIEIETNMTAESNKKKREQFTRPGVREPIILDMGKGFDKWKKTVKPFKVVDGELIPNRNGTNLTSEIDLIEKYIDERLVL